MTDLEMGWDLSCKSEHAEECGAVHHCKRQRGPNQPTHIGSLHKCLCGLKWDDEGEEW